MQEIIIDAISRYGYLSILLLIAAENIFPPIPSEVILTFAGFACTKTQLSYPGAVAFATLGSVLGAIVLYSLGRLLSKSRLKALVNSRLGKALRFNAADIDSAMLSFEKSGFAAVLMCRCVPIMRSLISIPAGITHMPILPFLGLTAVGSTMWNMLLIGLGIFAGENLAKITSAFTTAYSGIKILILAVAFIALLIILVRQNALHKPH